MSEETKEHEIEKLVDDIIKSPDFEALKRKATYLIKSSQTSEISQLKRKLEIVDSVLKQAQEDFDKQITELKEAFDTAHNTNIYLQKENEKLKAEPQAQSAEADSLGLYFERNKVAQPQQSVEADGYVAWHSKYNYYAPFFERHGEWEAWKTLISYIDPDFFKTLNKLAKEKNNHWFQGNHGEKVDRFPEQVKLEWDEKRRGIEMSGWQIRPVKLQFLDEGKCKKE